MKRRICISSDDDSSSSGCMPSWAGKSSKLDTLLEKLIDSILLMNDKVEGLSNRVNKLEEKVNEEIMKESTEFMNEVKSELAKLKKSLEEEQTVFVGSHLVEKLSNLQKSVESNLPVEIVSRSKRRGLSTSHSDAQHPSGWDKKLNVQQPNHGNRDLNLWDKHLNAQPPNHGNRDLNLWDKHLDVQHSNHRNMDLNSWDKQHLSVQQLNQVDSPRNLPVEGWSSRPWRTSHLDVQHSNHRNMDLNSWDKHLSVQQLNQVDSPQNLPQPIRQKPAESKLPVDTASCSEGWSSRPWRTSHLDVQHSNHKNRDLNSWDKHLSVQQLNQVDSPRNLGYAETSWGCSYRVSIRRDTRYETETP